MSSTWRTSGLCRSSSKAMSRRWRCPFLLQTDPTLPNQSWPGVKQHLLDVAHGGHLLQALGQVQPGGGHEGGEHPVSSDFCSINLDHINIIIIMLSYNFTFPSHLNQSTPNLFTTRTNIWSLSKPKRPKYTASPKPGCQPSGLPPRGSSGSDTWCPGSRSLSQVAITALPNVYLLQQVLL